LSYVERGGYVKAIQVEFPLFKDVESPSFTDFVSPRPFAGSVTCPAPPVPLSSRPFRPGCGRGGRAGMWRTEHWCRNASIVIAAATGSIVSASGLALAQDNDKQTCLQLSDPDPS